MILSHWRALLLLLNEEEPESDICYLALSGLFFWFGVFDKKGCIVLILLIVFAYFIAT